MKTDIVSVKLGEDAEITIDAIPGKFFKGKVTEVGTQAVLRSSGLASTQSTTGNQEAKDFKVVVTLQNPPDGLRPGLSSTGQNHHGAEEKRDDYSDSGARGAKRNAIWTKLAQGKTGKFRHAGGWPPRAWRDGPAGLPPLPRWKKIRKFRVSLWFATNALNSCLSRPESPASPTLKF